MKQQPNMKRPLLPEKYIHIYKEIKYYVDALLPLGKVTKIEIKYLYNKINHIKIRKASIFLNDQIPIISIQFPFYF